MRPSIRFGKIFGIEVGANWSVLVIASLLSFELTRGSGGGAAVWFVVIPMVTVFLVSLLAHELAHSVIAQRNGMEVRGITLWLLGGVAQLGGAMPSAGAQFRIAAAGPAMSYALAGMFAGVSVAASSLGVGSLVVSAIQWLALVNLVLGTFNLIPAAPLDGGRILASAVWAVTHDRTRADIVATRVGQGFGALAIGAGLVGPMIGIPFVSFWTTLMGFFVFRTATAELQNARLSAAVGDHRVGQVMVPNPETVRGWNTIAALGDEFASTPPRHHVLPVMGWDGAVVGVVTLEMLGRTDPTRRQSLRVQDIAVPMAAVGVASPGESALDVAYRMGTGPVPVVLVFDAGALVGMVTPAELRSRGRSNDLGAEASGSSAPGSTGGSVPATA